MSISARLWRLFVLLAVISVVSCGIFDGAAQRKKFVQIAIWEDQATLHGSDLLGYLSDRDVDVRRRAAIAVGRIGDTMAVDALIEALADPDTLVRARAAVSIGLLKHKPAKPLIYRHIKEENSGFVLEHQLWVMARLNGREYADSLLTFLEHPDPRVRRQAASIMGWFSHKSAVNTVARMIDDPDVTVRRSALMAIARLSPEGHAGRIAQKLQDPDLMTRSLAVRALGTTRDSTYVHKLIELLASPEQQIRISAIFGLGVLRDTLLLEAICPYLQTEEDPTVLSQLVEAVGRHAHIAAAPYLVKLKDHPDAGVRTKLLMALLLSLKEDSYEVLASFADDPAWSVRALLPRHLEYFSQAAWGHAEEATALMAKLAKDSVPGVRASVVKSSMNFGSALREPVSAALHDPDEMVRYCALNILPFAGGRVTFDTLLQWYVDQKDNTRPDIRMAILALTGNLSPSVQLGETQREIFNLGITDSDRLVRQYAAAVWEKFRENRWDEVGVFVSAINDETYDEYYREFPSRPRVRFVTPKGDFVVELYADETPRSVHHFLSLVRSGFYDQTPVGLKDNARTTNLGDRRGDSWGVSDATVRDEITLRRIERGSLIWSIIHRHDARSIFGVCLVPQPTLDFSRTVFGKVVEGMDVFDRLRPLDTVEKAEIISPEMAMQ